MGRLRATPAMAPWRAAACLKLAAEVRTVARPTAVFSLTIVPPAALMAARAAAGETPAL
jgi:hypothetical protein